MRTYFEVFRIYFYNYNTFIRNSDEGNEWHIGRGLHYWVFEMEKNQIILASNAWKIIYSKKNNELLMIKTNVEMKAYSLDLE